MPRGTVARRGTSTLELVFAVAVLLVGLLGYSRSLVQSVDLGQANREMAIATEAARRMLERISSAPLDQAFALYNADPADDPDGPGTGPGNAFAVRGLDLRRNDADGLHGLVVFPTVAGALREDLADEDLGLCRDLDLDGLVDAADHSDDYRILPVLVRIEWRSGDRNTFVAMQTIVGGR